MPRTVSLAIIRGDGIGQEVIAEALKVLDAALPADLVVETTEAAQRIGEHLCLEGALAPESARNGSSFTCCFESFLVW